jgi:multidrug efflux system membrane fusion protein
VQLVLLGDIEAVCEGTIHSFDNKIDTASGTIRARALFHNKDAALLPGMFATVRVGSPSEVSMIVVPERAIGTDQDRRFVYAVNDKNIVTYREVTLGEAVNGSRIILSGLQPGDKIVNEGIIKLRPDMPVAPQVGEAGDLKTESANGHP